MTEVPFGIMAWMGVVLFQALVHYGLLGPKRRKPHDNDFCLALEDSPLGVIHEQDAISEPCDSSEEVAWDGYTTPQPMSPCLRFRNYVENEGQLPNETRRIRQLLDQTGSELLTVPYMMDFQSMSFYERVAKEQMRGEDSGTSTASVAGVTSTGE
jgi:hypothetical protein